MMNFNDLVHSQCRPARFRDKKFILKYLRGKEFKQVVDLGCGYGEFGLEVANMVRGGLIGLELSDRECEVSKKNGISVVQTDLNDPLPLKDKSVDLAISIQVIEHLIQTDKFLDEVKRVLKKDGVFLMTTVNLAAVQYRVMLLLGMQPICLHPSVYQVYPLKKLNPVYGHKSVFTFEALKEVLQKHGMKIEKAYTHTIYLMPEWLSRALCKLRPNWGTFSCYVVRR